MQRTGKHDWRIAANHRFDLRIRLRSWLFGLQWSDYALHIRVGPLDLTVDRDPYV